MSHLTMKSVIINELYPFMKEMFYGIALEKENLKIDNIAVYNDKAQFVGGKIINFGSYVVTQLIDDKEEYKTGIDKLKKVINIGACLPMETWGILNALVGLYRLDQKGILHEVISDETLQILKSELDWRKFVDVNNNLVLIDKPTNYYGVAFGIARYRELLNWEPEGYALILLDKLMKHIDSYSGELSYMDETIGGGRFDRYSVLIPGEIATMISETKMKIPEKILKMLRNSSEIFLSLANEDGNGFSYGRSIGAYGDSAALEVLSIAAQVDGILTASEKEIAYTYNTKTIEKFISFWIDKDMKSINMWEKGRATDKYRNKNRILGENLSLCMQIVNSYKHWSNSGFENKNVLKDFNQRLSDKPPYSFFRFSNGKYDRAMAVIRDKDHVISLPLISGATQYYNMAAYLPIPFEDSFLEMPPDVTFANLVPQIILKDNTVIMPIANMKNIKEQVKDNIYNISYNIDEFCIINDKAKDVDKYYGIKAKTLYCFAPGRISREETLYLNADVNVQEISIEFATYSSGVIIKNNEVTFGTGEIQNIIMEGFDECTMQQIGENKLYNTPHGALKSKVKWMKRNIKPNDKITIKWVLNYK